MFAYDKLSPWESTDYLEQDKFILQASIIKQQYPLKYKNSAKPKRITSKALNNHPQKSMSGANIQINRLRLQSLDTSQKNYKIVSSREMVLKNFYENHKKIHKDQKNSALYYNFIKNKYKSGEDTPKKKASTPFIFNRIKSFIESKQNSKMQFSLSCAKNTQKPNNYRVMNLVKQAKYKKYQSVKQINFHTMDDPSSQKVIYPAGNRAYTSQKQSRNTRRSLKQTKQQKGNKKIECRGYKSHKNLEKLHFIDKYLDKMY